MVKLSAIQLTSTTCVQNNLDTIAKLLAKITCRVATDTQDIQHLVVLPECCLLFGGKESDQLSLAKISKKKFTQEAEDDINNEYQKESELLIKLGQLAKKFKVYLVAGTIPILNESGAKFTNTSCIFNPCGEIIGSYDKIHLFDVNVSDNTKNYHESRYTQAGKVPNVVPTAFANIGLTVCFDLRFPTLFQKLTQNGADIITVPSAFTQVTGEAHWQPLLQARAIENQVYIIASGQEGTHENGRKTWGHSMIINPWGEIEQSITTGEGYISVDYNSESITRIRKSMPLNSPFN